MLTTFVLCALVGISQGHPLPCLLRRRRHRRRQCLLRSLGSLAPPPAPSCRGIRCRKAHLRWPSEHMAPTKRCPRCISHRRPPLAHPVRGHVRSRGRYDHRLHGRHLDFHLRQQFVTTPILSFSPTVDLFTPSSSRPANQRICEPNRTHCCRALPCYRSTRNEEQRHRMYVSLPLSQCCPFIPTLTNRVHWSGSREGLFPRVMPCPKFIIDLIFRQLSLMHRVMARVMLLQIWIHGASRCASLLPHIDTLWLTHDPYIVSKSGTIQIRSFHIPIFICFFCSTKTTVNEEWKVLGLVAGIAYTLMVLLSFAPIRHRFYEFFFVTHFALALYVDVPPCSRVPLLI